MQSIPGCRRGGCGRVQLRGVGAPTCHDLDKPSRTRARRSACKQVYRSSPSARGEGRARSHPVHGAGRHAVRAGRLTGRMAAVIWRAAWAICWMRGRCTSTGISGTPTRSISGSAPKCGASWARYHPRQHRPIYITEFGVRGLGTFEGEVTFDPGFWPDGTGMSATEMSAFQHAWFNLRAAQLGYSGTVKWDRVPGQVRRGHAGLLRARSGRRGLARATRLQPPPAARRGRPSHGAATSSR